MALHKTHYPIEMVKVLLVAGADIEYRDKEGRTCLYIAALAGHAVNKPNSTRLHNNYAAPLMVIIRQCVQSLVISSFRM